ncbi:MAG: hypothetical protein JXA22_08855 [Candidatus Thermoplasmatota archaeon]|nr:hypothetical protein [Candidatus Thermoplasmatota archaeon]
MWLIILALAAALSTLIWYASVKARKTYKLGVLNLILWGTTVMVLVDHVIGYITEGGVFMEMTLDAFLLSMVLLVTALLVWFGVMIFSRYRHPSGT